MSRSKLPFSWLSRLILNNSKALNRLKPSRHHPLYSIPSPFPFLEAPPFPFLQSRRFYISAAEVNRLFQEFLADVGKEKQLEREAKRKAGINVDEEEEEEERKVGGAPLFSTGKKDNINYDLEEDSESATEEEDDDEERAEQMRMKAVQLMERKIKRHKELMKGFMESDNLDDAFKWMSKIDKFEVKHLRFRPEYRVIGEVLNRFKVATDKDKFLLAMKLNRGMRLVERREKFDTSNPANYHIIQSQGVGPSVELMDDADDEMKREAIEGDNEVEEFDDMKERDDILLLKLAAIDKKLEEKLAALDHTFGRKGKLLEEEIRDLAEERNSLTEKKRIPMYRRGFDIHSIDMKRTCKVTKGGRVVKYTAILACGNYNGVVGYAKAKGPSVLIAQQKAYAKCFQNLHTFDRYEDHTIAHAIQKTYKKTKVYLWPARTVTGMKAGRTVQTVLNLAGFRNIKSKVIGSKNPYNTVKALFHALDAIETPKDVREKFGRTVVESYLL